MAFAPTYRAIRAHIIVLAMAVFMASCVRAPETHVFSFTRFAMDTVVEYTILAESHDRAREAVDAAHEEIERVERLLWEDAEGSEIRLLNHAEKTATLRPEAFEFVSRTLRYAERSGGAFDASIKPVLDLYEFGSEEPSHPTAARLAPALVLVGSDQFDLSAGPTVTKKSPAAAIGVGGIAKGYAVDRAVAVLRDFGVENAVVNAGGDAYGLGSNRGKPWRVGIRHPDDHNALVAVLELSDRAVATSGDYERFFEVDGRRYHHLLDPRTGVPGSGTRSATVVAPSAEAADALSTAVFILGKREGILLAGTFQNVEALVVDSALTITATETFPMAVR